MKKLIYLILFLPIFSFAQNKTIITWDGSSSDDWQTAANWDSGTIPTSTDDVIIADVTTQPIINDDATLAECNNLTISSGADLTIASNGRITVSGTLTNNAGNSGLIIEAGGSLIHSTANVPATVKIYLAGEQWHYVSAPVSGLSNTNFSATDFKTWDASAEWDGSSFAPWGAYTGGLSAGIGYANYEPSTTKALTGNLNQGSYAITINKSATGDVANQGWNLVGNPYTSAINWTAVDRVTPDLNNAVYYYNGSQYASYVNGSGVNGGTQYIPVGQGFFVKGNTDNATLTLNNDDRVHNTQTFWKGQKEKGENTLRLLSQGNGYIDEILVKFVKEATFHFDGEYDAYKLLSTNEDVPQIYSLDSAKSTKYSINSLPFLSEAISIPIGLSVTPNGDYTISASEINIDYRYLFLEDLVLDSITDLKKIPVYKYYYPGGGENENRFILHIIPNSSPICSNPIENITTNEDNEFNFTFDENVFSDSDNDNLTYFAQQTDNSNLPNWLNFSSATRTFSGIPENDDVDTLLISLYALDNYGDTAMCEFELAIVNTNDAPFVDNLISNQVTYVDSIWEFTFAENTFGDIDINDELTYSSTLVGGEDLPNWLNFDPNTKTYSGTAGIDNAETLSIKLFSTDNYGESAICEFDLTIVNINDSPVCSNPIENISTNEDEEFEYIFNENVFSDADNDELTYFSKLSDGSILPYWLSFSNTSRTFSGIPENEDVDTLTICLYALDNFGDTAMCEFEIAIVNTNDAPFVDNLISNQITYVDSIWEFTFAENTFGDVDLNDELTYSSTLVGGEDLPNWLNFDPTTKTFSGTHTMAEDIDILVTATDLSLEEVSSEFRLYVVNVVDIENFSDNIQVYPNPSNGIFTIEGNDIQSIEIMNIKGEIIHSEQNISQLQNTINISEMPNGLYFININTEYTTVVRKIIIN